MPPAFVTAAASSGPAATFLYDGKEEFEEGREVCVKKAVSKVWPEGGIEQLEESLHAGEHDGMLDAEGLGERRLDLLCGCHLCGLYEKGMVLRREEAKLNNGGGQEGPRLRKCIY